MKIDEVIDSRNKGYIKEIIDDIEYYTTVDMRPAGLISGIRMLSSYGLTVGEIRTILRKFKPKILNYLNVMLHSHKHLHGELPAWFDTILVMTDEAGVTWPEITSIVDAHKDTIIKLLLHAMKESDTGSVHYTIEHLNKMNLNWPELSVIEKSAKAEQANRKKGPFVA